ncbi:MAG: TetR/AcrR family transcriptional regulator [Anaerolineae bacterium]
MPRKPADQTVQRRDILLAAAHVFRERGYAHATMSDIAKRVKLTAGSLYHHFPSKQEILIAVLNEGIQALLSEMERVAAAELPPAEALRQMITIHVLAVTSNLAVGAAMVFEIRALLDVSETDQLVAERNAFLARRAAFERYFREVIERGMATGDFRRVDSGIFTKALLGAHNWIGVWYRDTGRLSAQEIAAHMVDTFLRSLCK